MLVRNKSNSMSAFIFGTFFGFLIFFTVVVFIMPEDTILYKKGQIDAMNGKILFKIKDPSNKDLYERYEKQK